MMSPPPAAAFQALQQIDQDLRHWDDIIDRLAKDYARAKAAAERRPGSGVAAAALLQLETRLLHAMGERHRSEACLSELRDLLEELASPPRFRVVISPAADP